MAPDTPPEIDPDKTENDGYLPGLAPIPPGKLPAGFMEQAIRDQIDEMRRQQLLTAAHAGQAALAIRAARDVDQSEGKGAPSGRANLLRVMNEILGQLPAVETAGVDELDKAVAAIMRGEAPGT